MELASYFTALDKVHEKTAIGVVRKVLKKTCRKTSKHLNDGLSDFHLTVGGKIVAACSFAVRPGPLEPNGLGPVSMGPGGHTRAHVASRARAGFRAFS